MAALTDGQIRLLSFHDSLFDDGFHEDVFRLSVRTYDRASAPPYTALSYEWGSSTNPGCIEVDGKPRSARRNLCDALMFLPDHATGLVWIDALCIDQENANERNHQVRAMGEIYNRAELVIAWLGWADDAIKPCFAATGRENVTTAREARRALVRRKYWTRLWIYQDLILAKEIRVACGPFSMTYSELEGLLWNVDGDFDAHRICYAVLRGPSYDLCEALAQFSTCLCADVRDRLFAVLSVVKPDERQALLQVLPDYSAATSELVSIAQAHIHQHRRRINTTEPVVERALAVLASMKASSATGPSQSEGYMLHPERGEKGPSVARYGPAGPLATVQWLPHAAPQSRREGTPIPSPPLVPPNVRHLIDPAFDPGYAPLRSPRPVQDSDRRRRGHKSPELDELYRGWDFFNDVAFNAVHYKLEEGSEHDLMSSPR